MPNEQHVRSSLKASIQVGAAFLAAGTKEIARLETENEQLRIVAGAEWRRRAESTEAKVAKLERLLDRAYPWLHNPYHGTSDTLNAAEGDAVIREVEHAIAHLKEEPDPLLSLDCASCDGTGKIDTGDTLLACPNCTPQLER